MSKTKSELPEAVIEHLKQANVVMIATISEDGQPSLDLLSWVWPMDAKTVRLVISPNFPGGINLVSNDQAALQIIDDKLTYEVKGKVRLILERCESVKFPETMYDLLVEEVRENMFPASHLIGPIPYARDEGTEALHKELDDAIYNEIKTT
jgi:predicted pyridoxine 5'-phosphate oxidase superfamily flavin-nucleotide-binding protein